MENHYLELGREFISVNLMDQETEHSMLKLWDNYGDKKGNYF